LESRNLLTITVNTLVDEADGSIDDGDVSLRDAIAVAAGGETIDFDASLDGGTILLTLGELAVTRSMTIDATALALGLTIDASGNDPTPDENNGDGSRVFNIDDAFVSHSEVTLSGLTLTGGDVDGDGGAVRALEILRVTSSTISNNSAGGSGGGISGSSTVTSSNISNNTAADGGGAISIIDEDNVTVTNSTISGNSARFGGGIRASGDTGYLAVTVTNSTISDNSAVTGGGGISAFNDDDVIVTVTSSTISGNSAGGNGGGILSGDDVRITSSTISGNSASERGGGIYAGQGIRMLNSIVAANNGNIHSPDIELPAGEFTTTHSLIGDNTGTRLAEAPVGMPDENGNLIGDPNGTGVIDPLFSPLGNFGGSTQTHALLPGSPAVNAGDPDFVAPPDHDQRGAPFDRVSGDRIDMGAFEAQIAPVDFNDDGQLDCADVDALVDAIVKANNPPAFDFTGDDIVNQGDLDVWLSLAGLENLPSHVAHVPGDVNLDGMVDAIDLNLVGLNWLQDVTGWCSGDLTSDGVVDARDLNKLGLNWLQDVSSEAVAVVGRRVPRAPLADHAVAAIAAAPPDSLDFMASTEPTSKSRPGEMTVESGTEYISFSNIEKPHLRRGLRSSSTRIKSVAHDFLQSRQLHQEQLVDEALKRWSGPAV
jgi:predicted outer membrane repeat protein